MATIGEATALLDAKLKPIQDSVSALENQISSKKRAKPDYLLDEKDAKGGKNKACLITGCVVGLLLLGLLVGLLYWKFFMPEPAPQFPPGYNPFMPQQPPPQPPPEVFSDVKWKQGRCSDRQYECPGSGECIVRNWRCDEEDDCPDGADEQDCPTKPVSSRMRPQMTTRAPPPFSPAYPIYPGYTPGPGYQRVGFNASRPAPDLCAGKRCGEQCDTSSGMLQVMRYCQPDGSCGMNSRPSCTDVRFLRCVEKWCHQNETSEQYTSCEAAWDGGDTCINPTIKYGATEGGIPASHISNDYDAWCKQIFGVELSGSITTGPRDCSRPKGKLFWCSMYDEMYDESRPHWCDWSDGYWKSGALDQNSGCSDAINSLTCR